MDYRDTLMSSKQWDKIYSDWLKFPGGTAGDLANKMNEAQAEISFRMGYEHVLEDTATKGTFESIRKLGIKEVVETYKRENPSRYKEYEAWWRMKEQKWGIDESTETKEAQDGSIL